MRWLVLSSRAALVALVVGSVLPVAAAVGQTVNPDATIVVTNLTPVEGETVPVHNAPNDDSRCVGGTVVLMIDGMPAGLAQLVTTPDANGDWQVDMQVPTQADYTNAYVKGPYTVHAFCWDLPAATDVQAAAEPEFAYVPVVVTQQQPEPVAPITPPVAAPAPALAATPTFTG